MVGVRETRRNWEVDDYRTTSHWGGSTLSAGASSGHWKSTARADYTPKDAAGQHPTGRHEARLRDPHNWNDGRGSERISPWSSTFQTTHSVGRGGYMFLGIPQRFKERQIPPSEPLDDLTINRDNFRGAYTAPPKSLKNYWERVDEYKSSSTGMRMTRDTSKHPYCSPQNMKTTTHSTHVPLDEKHAAAYHPKQRHRTDHVLSARPAAGGGKLSSDTCFRDSYGMGRQPPNSNQDRAAAGLIKHNRTGLGKKQLTACIPGRPDVIREILPMKAKADFGHITENKAEFVPKTVRQTDWYGSIPQDFEYQREGETHFFCAAR